jgi:UDP-2,3-diacylglucosamine hydrolase
LAQLKNKVCLIGGRGQVVLDSANSLSNKNILSKIILLEKNIEVVKKFNDITYHYSIKRFENILKKLEELNIKKVLIIGYVELPKFNQINFNIKSKIFLSKNYFFNNESNQTKILKNFLLSKNIQLLSPTKYLNELLINSIDEIKVKNFDKYRKSLLSNINNLKKISSINIGQSLIMNGDRILALENYKGTNKLLELFNKNKYFSELIFVKFKKINQINELDFPVIGPETIKKLIKIKIKAMVLFKNKTLIVDKINCIKLLKKNNINLIVL